MAKTFQIEVVTPDATALSTEADSLTVPAWEGYLGVLANHAPLLTVLKPGVVTVSDEKTERYFAIRGGFMEVAANRAVILADDLVEGGAVDSSAVEQELEAAKAPTEEASGKTAADRSQAREHLAREREQARLWAEARLQAAAYARGA